MMSMSDDKSIVRSFPRKREPRATTAEPTCFRWVPAFAGTSGE
jgi:hypothetical protein